MSCFSRCSWCGDPFNGSNCRHYTDVSFEDELVYDSNPDSYNQTPDFSNPPPHHNYEIDSRYDTGAAFQAEFENFQQNFERFMAQLSCSNCSGLFNGGNCPSCSIVGAENKFVHDPNPFPYDNTPDFYDQPPQHHVETYSCELCRNDSHYGYDCPPRFLLYPFDQSHPQEMSIQDMKDLKQQYLNEMKSMINQIQIEDYRNERIDIRYRRECEIKINELKENFNGMSIEINKKKELRQLENAANLSTYTTEPSRRFNSFFYDEDDYEESTIPLNELVSLIPPSIAITPVLPTMEPEDSFIIGDEDLHTIPEKELDEFIKFSVKDLVSIPTESEDTSRSDSECDLPACDDFSPIDVLERRSVTFSNPLFDSNDDFTSSDDESLSDEDVPEENFKIYSNPLFEFDDEYISSDVNPLFDEVLKNIKNKDSYYSNLDEPDLLVTPLSDANEDECFDPGDDVDEIEFLLHRDPSIPKMSVASILEGFTTEPPLEENDDLFDLESKEYEWKKILYDALIDNLMTEDKVFDPRTYVSLPFKDRHYLFFTYVIIIFLPYFTYSVDSSFLLSSRSEDTIFDPDIFAFHLESVASHRSGTFMCFNVYPNILNESPMEICSSIRFDPNITMI
nr:hypothetical protein [Tanacetum cinerariifolium]